LPVPIGMGLDVRDFHKLYIDLHYADEGDP